MRQRLVINQPHW